MEFEQLQKIWIEEKQENYFAINETTMHNNIRDKKAKATHLVNLSELLTILVNIFSGIFIMVISYLNQSGIWLYVLGGWMAGTALYALFHRFSRLRSLSNFGNSVHEDLRYGIKTASAQVRLSRLMRLNVIPVGVITSLAIWNSGKSLWFVAGVVLFMAFAYYVSGWEHNIYRKKLKELEGMRKLLEA